jgi:RES domain-containing protein
MREHFCSGAPVLDRKPRDLALLDALDACPREAFEGSAWRIVREGRDPLLGSPSGARWDPGTFDVLYTALARDGALAEIHFHLSRQPVIPSKVQFHLYELAVRAAGLLRLLDMAVLERLGIERERYAEPLYRQTQEIGDAAQFLGFAGLIVPSARWSGSNLVFFTDRLEPDTLAVLTQEPIDWAAWRRAREERG